MTIKYANGWWGIYGADPFHVPKFKKFIDAVRWAKEHRGLKVPALTTPSYGFRFPNRLHISIPRPRTNIASLETYDLYNGIALESSHSTLHAALTAAHKHAATTR